MKHKWGFVLVVATGVWLVSRVAEAAPGFTLHKQGEQVCQDFRNYRANACYQSFEGTKTFMNLKAPSKIDLLQEARQFDVIETNRKAGQKSVSNSEFEKSSAAFLMMSKVRSELLAEFTQLEVSNLAVATDRIHKSYFGNFLPMVGTVTWKSTVGQGVLHFQALVRLPDDDGKGLTNQILDRAQTVEEIVSGVGLLFKIESIGDETYEMRDARFKHYRQRDGFWMAAPDASTTRLIEKTIAPALFSKLVVAPILMNLSRMFGGFQVRQYLPETFKGEMRE